jgi:hypothetical protein
VSTSSLSSPPVSDFAAIEVSDELAFLDVDAGHDAENAVVDIFG